MMVVKHLLSEEIGGHGFDREGQFWGVSRNGGAELSPSPPSTANVVSYCPTSHGSAYSTYERQVYSGQ